MLVCLLCRCLCSLSLIFRVRVQSLGFRAPVAVCASCLEPATKTGVFGCGSRGLQMRHIFYLFTMPCMQNAWKVPAPPTPHLSVDQGAPPKHQEAARARRRVAGRPQEPSTTSTLQWRLSAHLVLRHTNVSVSGLERCARHPASLESACPRTSPAGRIECKGLTCRTGPSAGPSATAVRAGCRVIHCLNPRARFAPYCLVVCLRMRSYTWLERTRADGSPWKWRLRVPAATA